MKSRIRSIALVLSAVVLAAGMSNTFARQSNAPQSNSAGYHVILIPGTITAVNYQHRESTMIGFQGSPLLPLAKGTAKVSSRSGRIAIEATFQDLQPAQKFGPALWTYVLWAITPEGKANNLGEVLLDGNKSKISVTTSLQTFGMIVTAEPYFAVSEPSDVIVLANVVLPGTSGTFEQMSATYQSIGRGSYDYDVAHVTAGYPRSKYPTLLELSEARNAIEIARTAGAGQYASDAFKKAQTSLLNAEQLNSSKGNRSALIQSARDAVQNAADSRRIALQAQQDQADAQARDAAAQRTADAQAAAARATLSQQQEALARQQAELAQQQAQAQAAQDAAARAQAEAQARQDQLAAAAAQQQAAAAQQSAADAQQQAAAAQQQAAAAELAREQLRASLLEQFNRILPTTDTPQGLQVDMADVLFATAKYDLKPPAREALAKFSGIVIAHQGLKMAIGGYTDSVGGDALNMTLSENRANAVKAYLVSQGIDPNLMTSTGYGMSNPVADNSTAAGRQQNRRVVIIISGEIIGTKIGGN
jgi:outer membrane protein OmpA-like peptidoglycan-associated protein